MNAKAAKAAKGTRVSRPSNVLFTAAQPDDSAAIAALHNVIAERLTSAFGKGHWSYRHTEQSVRSSMKRAKVFVARSGTHIAATFTLATKKPWAIDRSYFTSVTRPLYLLSMAVDPDLHRLGLGRRCLDEARAIAKAWPADALFLDAYDTAADAGGFYRTCGFREVGRVTYKGTPLIYYEWLVKQP
jgi:ribosomal protein S18 acetylase RimI-like enzyme